MWAVVRAAVLVGRFSGGDGPIVVTVPRRGLAVGERDSDRSANSERRLCDALRSSSTACWVDVASMTGWPGWAGMPLVSRTIVTRIARDLNGVGEADDAGLRHAQEACSGARRSR